MVSCCPRFVFYLRVAKLGSSSFEHHLPTGKSVIFFTCWWEEIVYSSSSSPIFKTYWNIWPCLMNTSTSGFIRVKVKVYPSFLYVSAMRARHVDVMIPLGFACLGTANMFLSTCCPPLVQKQQKHGSWELYLPILCSLSRFWLRLLSLFIWLYFWVLQVTQSHSSFRTV